MNELARTALQQGHERYWAGDFMAAMACYEQARAAAPADEAPLLALGATLHELERFNEALTAYDIVLQLNPALGEAWNNRGNTLLALGVYAEALASYERAHALLPDNLDALVASGTCLERLGRRAEALAHYQAVLERDPQCAEAHWNLALALLAEGEYLAGWEEFAWRWRKKGYTTVWREFAEPLWDGSPLEGRTILIHAEQAFGDTLQFVRYLPLLARQGGRVLLECPPPLVPLLAEVAGVDQVLPAGAPLPPFDCHLPLLSLPGLFKTTLLTIPRDLPYLKAPVERTECWRARIAGDSTYKVGLVWAGRRWPDPFRSCRLADLAPLADVPGVSFYSLQLGAEGDQTATPPPGMQLIDLTAAINDFADTAALISLLDLVVSVDTAVAHLAGGLGKPLMLLAPFAPDWRWCFDDPAFSWYPSMTICVQERLGSWREPVLRAKEMLAGYVTGASYPLPTASGASPLRIFCYKADVHYLLTPRNRYLNIRQVPLAAALAAGHAALEEVTDPAVADFILFPEYLDAMLDNVGIEGTRQFIHGLPFFSQWEDRHIFCMNHDTAEPFGFSSIFFQVSVNRFNHDPHAVAVPYPPEWITAQPAHFDLEKIRYLASFNGNIASVLLRAELVLAVMKEERLSVFVDPTIAFHCHLSEDQKDERKIRYLQTIADSLTVLCPRGEGLNSIRFYETLAAGRIPVLVSDSCLLPFEDELPYDQCIFRIAEADIPRAGLLLADWIVATGPERLLVMCRRAREIWEAYLSEPQMIPRAVAALRKILAARPCPAPAVSVVVPAMPDPLKEQAITLHEQGDFVAARPIYDRLLAMYPDDADLYYLRGTLELQDGTPAEAVRLLERAVHLVPGQPAYAMHLALAFQSCRRYGEAEQVLRALTQSHPDSSNAWLNLGVTLQAQENLAEALACFRRAEGLAPHDPRAPQNAANVYQAMGYLDDAERQLIRALILKPDYGTALWNLAILRLLQGDYERGFRDFDARFVKADPVPRRYENIPEWDGVTTSKTLLIWDEQGFGDALQCARYFPLVSKMVGTVYFECLSQGLVDLMRTVPGLAGVFVKGDLLPAFDLQVPVMSLLRLLGSTLASIPNDVPYLFPPAAEPERWQGVLSGTGLRVGLVWRGNPQHANDRNRSCSITEFSELFGQSPGCRFISLQVKPTAEESSVLSSHGVIDPTATLRTFADTASLVMALDLMITVDTAVAHLAGALGRPVWLLLPHIPDWRWGLSGESTPWYPTMRLFRQESRGDWPGVLARVKRELAAMAADRAQSEADSTTLPEQMPRITMSSLGRYGLGNQIFQYAYLKIYAQKNNLKTETPVWLGTFLFGHTDSPITVKLPEICFDANSHNRSDIPEMDGRLRNVDIEGFFQYHTSYYAPDKDYFRSLFQPVPALAARLSRALENLRQRGKTVVGIHIRRGDYAYANHPYLYIAPHEWYLEWLQGIWSSLEAPVLFIASDEPERVFPDFAEYMPVSFLDLDPTLTPDNFCADYYVDFYLLSKCDIVAISNSTFSFAASMLNEEGKRFFRPDAQSRKLVPFDPWDSEVLLIEGLEKGQ